MVNLAKWVRIGAAVRAAQGALDVFATVQAAHEARKLLLACRTVLAPKREAINHPLACRTLAN
jgi:hypothetical protein